MAITFPYTFASQAGSVPASELDSNYQFCSLLAGSVPLAGTLTGSELILLYQNGVAVAQSIVNIASVTGGGVATEANKLTTARTIAASGDVTWSVSFDGSANVSSGASVVSASTSTAGKVQLATSAQAAGSSASVALTPASIAGNLSAAGSGYIELPGGLLIQWGGISSGTSGSITYPKPFASQVYSIVASTAGSAGQTNSVAFNTGSGTTTSISWYQSTSYAFSWIAIGV